MHTIILTNANSAKKNTEIGKIQGFGLHDFLYTDRIEKKKVWFR